MSKGIKKYDQFRETRLERKQISKARSKVQYLVNEESARIKNGDTERF
jgi:hypothetical protein